MAGGLIQIVAYGTADVFLTGMPQITFFKLVYRRHTNFAIENIEQDFSGIKNFGNIISCTLDKVGDLVNKMYLKIVLPKVYLSNPNYISDYNEVDQIEINNLKTQYNEYKIILKYIYKFYIEINNYISKINQNINYNNLFNQIKNITNSYYTSTEYNNLKTTYNSTYNTLIFLNEYIILRNTYDNQVLADNVYQDNRFNTVLVYNIDLVKTFYNYKQSDYLTSADFLYQINFYDLPSFKTISRIIDHFFYLKIQKYEYIYSNYPNYKYAWINKIGHKIIHNISLEIGGQKIDQHDSDWFNIWNDLSLNSELENIYNKMIGNIPSLTTFDNSSKDSYTLYVPLQFWFNKYISASIPLIFLRYSDVRIQLELTDIRKLFFTDAPSDFNFEDNIELVNISLLVDYIYLDVDERSKFAQSSQEYLIEVVQNYNYPNINSNNVTIESFFINSIKEMFWVVQNTINLTNNISSIYDLAIIYLGTNITKVYTNNSSQIVNISIGAHIISIGDIVNIFNSENYNGNFTVISVTSTSINIYSRFWKNEQNCFVQLVELSPIIQNQSYPSGYFYGKNPFITTSYTFEQYNRFNNYDGSYTNYVIPYQYHTKTPSDGINIYTFALLPEEYQPSGAVNLSTYKYKSFVFVIHQKLIDHLIKVNDTLTIKTYAIGYNILSLQNGYAGLVFNI
uniref:Major capsid protein N-terminal domain-containing protein n=1 Tax=viral metagenome TaxID=1070528 RepID=A0A6C0H0P5_9ZZZZ